MWIFYCNFLFLLAVAFINPTNAVEFEDLEEIIRHNEFPSPTTYEIEIDEDYTSTPFQEDTTVIVEGSCDDDLRILNADFDKLGRIYVTQYYSLFDDPKKRLSLVALYHPEDSFLTFEGERYRGPKRILEKFQKLNLKHLQRKISSIDIQPLLDGGIVINVVGQVHENDKPDHFYSQTFIYKPQKGSFFLQHDIFRVLRP